LKVVALSIAEYVIASRLRNLLDPGRHENKEKWHATQAGRQEMRNCPDHGLYERYESGYQFKQQKEFGDDVERRSFFWGKRIEARAWRNERRIDPEEWEIRDDVVAGFSAMGQRNPDGFRSLVSKSRLKTDIQTTTRQSKHNLYYV
jgi:hypothetical protein